ncbi:hypothetical protein FQA39_LY05016 [Lamprigera yunnana]|nr:hypothetical protein FQA39_LY05016 [Lamprigera yunnana]
MKKSMITKMASEKAEFEFLLQALIPSIKVGLGIFILFSRLENGVAQIPYLWDSELVYVSLFFVTTTTIISSGASLILTQVDLILSQYFKLKLEVVRTIIYLSEAMGFVITPIVLGHCIVQSGILTIITWYQAIILQGIIFSIAFKKPKYLKLYNQRYNLILSHGEEEDVFAKATTELQQPRTNESASSSNNAQFQTECNIENLEMVPKISKNWETFEESSNSNGKGAKVHMELHNSFAAEFDKDLNKINNFENTDTVVPTPLFFESRVNNNMSYSYESPIEVNSEPVVFMPIEKPIKQNRWKQTFRVLKDPAFYKTLLLVVTKNCSLFIFWTLFPSYMYTKIEYLKVHNTAAITGYVSLGSLIFVPILNWVKNNREARFILLWIFCWIGSIGYISLTNRNIFGAFIIILSLNGQEILGYQLITSNNCERSSQYVLVNVLSGISLSVFLINMSYETCFQMLSVLNFLTGSLWLVNFLYKRINK